MLNLISKYTALLAVATVITLVGCGEQGNPEIASTKNKLVAEFERPAQATAKEVISSAFKSSVTNEAMLEAFKQQPEYEYVLACVELQLASIGWTSDQHEFFMKATGGSGDVRKIKQDQFTEEQIITNFIPVFHSSSECMNAVSN